MTSPHKMMKNICMNIVLKYQNSTILQREDIANLIPKVAKQWKLRSNGHFTQLHYQYAIALVMVEIFFFLKQLLIINNFEMILKKLCNKMWLKFSEQRISGRVYTIVCRQQWCIINCICIYIYICMYQVCMCNINMRYIYKVIFRSFCQNCDLGAI